MKRAKVLTMCCLLMASLFVAVPVLAKKGGVVYRASGRLESYVDAYSSEIVNGHWHLKIMGEEVEFFAFYRERNLDEGVEGSPEGTVDHFFNTVTNVEDYETDGDTCVIWCDIHVDKLWWNIATGLPEWTEWDTYDVVITVDPDGVFIDVPSVGPQDWDRYGPTNSLQFK